MVGMALHVFSIGALFYFNDDDALGKEADALIAGEDGAADEV